MKKTYVISAITITLFSITACSTAYAPDETSTETSTPTETTAPTKNATETTTPTANKVVFNVTGKNFSYSQTAIRVKKGDIVTINFTSEFGTHDWVIDEFNARTAIVKDSDNPTSTTFTADKTGTFEYYCSVGNHRANGMVGKLIVE